MIFEREVWGADKMHSTPYCPSNVENIVRKKHAKRFLRGQWFFRFDRNSKKTNAFSRFLDTRWIPYPAVQRTKAKRKRNGLERDRTGSTRGVQSEERLLKPRRGRRLFVEGVWGDQRTRTRYARTDTTQWNMFRNDSWQYDELVARSFRRYYSLLCYSVRGFCKTASGADFPFSRLFHLLF